MHTAHVSNLRSALLEYFDEDDPDWLLADFDTLSLREIDPHSLEHEARAAELLEEDDEDGSLIHQLLAANIQRAARGSN